MRSGHNTSHSPPAAAGTLICVLPPSCRLHGPWVSRQHPCLLPARVLCQGSAFPGRWQGVCPSRGGGWKKGERMRSLLLPPPVKLMMVKGGEEWIPLFSFPWEISSWSLELGKPGQDVTCTWLIPSWGLIMEWALELQSQRSQLKIQLKKGSQVTWYKWKLQPTVVKYP